VSQKALLGLIVAVFIPVISYFIVKNASENAIAMPGRFFYDTVTTKMKDGKQITDTLWHSVKNITLTNQLGTQVSLDDLKGKVIVVDYFFTHCLSICPMLTHNIKQFQDALKLRDDMKGTDTTFVHFISFSVDPQRDSSTVLKKYGDRFGVNPDVWWLLTGPKKTIYDFALTELKLGLQDGQGVDSNFIHTQKIALLDKQHIVRGYYDGLDSASLSKLAKDIVFIMLEKDKNSKSELAELKSLWPIFLFVLIATAAGVYFFSRKPDINK
jgi:protein SCO1/2